ncbi:unnamed protein product [Paramecium sonneborni]|uniref:Transmembrane protein n=1 Tax=Paramecium sonneborni TaxID=65129 RepID=A0A8S1R0F6_9CILI|nr:unnamed protein product [Paramecium sonneborni]
MESILPLIFFTLFWFFISFFGVILQQQKIIFGILSKKLIIQKFIQEIIFKRKAYYYLKDFSINSIFKFKVYGKYSLEQYSSNSKEFLHKGEMMNEGMEIYIVKILKLIEFQEIKFQFIWLIQCYQRCIIVFENNIYKTISIHHVKKVQEFESIVETFKKQQIYIYIGFSWNTFLQIILEQIRAVQLCLMENQLFNQQNLFIQVILLVFCAFNQLIHFKRIAMYNDHKILQSFKKYIQGLNFYLRKDIL